MMICVFAASFLVLEDFSSFLCVETSRPVRQTPSSERVLLWIDTGSVLRTWRTLKWRRRCWWWGQRSRDVTGWMRKREQRHDARWTEDAHLLSHWATWNVRSMCCGACTRKVCVCVQLGWHSVYTFVALTAVAAGWVRNLVSASFLYKNFPKKNDSGWLSRTRCFRRVWWSSWWSHCAQFPVLKHSIAHFNVVPLLPLSDHLSSCQLRWFHESQFDESHQLELGVQVDEEDDGWSVKVCFSFAKYSAQSYSGHWKKRTLFVSGWSWSFNSFLALVGMSSIPYLFATTPALKKNIFSVPGTQVLTLRVPIQIFA